MPFAKAWMDLEGIMLSEISQREKDKFCTISLTCGIFKKKKAKIPQNPQTQRYREQIGGVCQRLVGGWGGVEWAKWVKGVRRYKLPVKK